MAAVSVCCLRYCLAHFRKIIIIAWLEHFTVHDFDFIAKEFLEPFAVNGNLKVSNGKVIDSWGRLYKTLNHF